MVVSTLDIQSDFGLDQSVGGSRVGWSLDRCVVSLDKKLSLQSLFTQLYKWVLVTYCWV